ncbi:MAG: HEAT repeat domain-containing protein [Planctomycetaceae bacterium]
MGDANGPDVNALAAHLAADDLPVRREAAERLARLGESAAPAAAALVRACGDADEQVREQAVAALEDLGPPPPAATGQLGDLVAHRDPLVAYWATTLLGRAGEDAATAVPVLVGCLESTVDLAVRQRAAWALGKIGPAAAAARDALARAASAEDPRLARLAAEAIDALGG